MLHAPTLIRWLAEARHLDVRRAVHTNKHPHSAR